MGKIRVALIGVGNMGYNHARVLSEISTFELVAVADTSKEKLKKVVKYCKNHYLSYKEMIEAEDLDAVIIVVPTSLHKEVSVNCMNKELNVFVEKPIASSIMDAKAIIEASKKNNVKLMVGHIERYNPAVIELKKRIKNGQIGKVFKIDVNRVGPFPERIRDVGVVIDLAVHDIDIARFILESEVDRVYAETEKRIHTKKEDLLSGLIKFKNDTICNLNINWLTPTKIRKLYVTGEKGMFVVDYINQTLFFYENPESKENALEIVTGISEGEMTRYVIPKKEPLKVELEAFYEYLSTGKNVIASANDGLMALYLAKRLVESGEKNEVLKCKSVL